MTTQYTLRITIAVPEAHLDDANQLALVLGESSNDDQTFTTADWEDGEGNMYAIASTAAKPVFIELATQPLQAPVHAPDVDLEAATQAQALIAIEDRNNGGSVVTASPDHIATIIDHRLANVQEHIAALGLKEVKEEEELLGPEGLFDSSDLSS